MHQLPQGRCEWSLAVLEVATEVRGLSQRDRAREVMMKPTRTIFFWGINSRSFRGFCSLVTVLILTPTYGAGQDSPHGPIKIACDQCHTADSWVVLKSPMEFKHSSTKFPLDGQHAVVSCRACHSTLRFAGIGTECKSCHQDVHRGELGLACERCHSPQSWLVPDMPQRHTQTRFPLVGAHLTAACEQCHKNQQKHEYIHVPVECYGCHKEQFQATMAPAHAQSGIGTDCASCHSVNSMRWGGSFDHSLTGFPLTGAHRATFCARCHPGNRYAGTPSQCVSCHQGDYAASKNPPHASNGFPTDCMSCHTTTAWHPATFDHNTTGFPLTGAHAGVQCAQCHPNGRYAGTPTTCVSCHQGDFSGAMNPPHAASGFPTDCTTCHSTLAWQPATFDHSKTGFSLTGAHASVLCVQCHPGGRFAGTPTTCVNCHQQQFTAANAPPHTGFSTDCTTCHTTTAWQPATFNHNNTPFPLTGGHTTVACAQCHVNNVYAGLTTDCYTCHKTTFASATTPVPHTGFPTACVTCHTTNPGWAPSTFDHNNSPFPLTGAHPAVACAQCHVNNVYVGLSTTCYGCHQQQFTAANAPPHTGFSTDCTTCHTTTAWQPATFNHNNTPFPLTGGHITVACTQCHVNNVYAGLTTDCYTCHKATFASATTPVPHTGFPTACVTCHTTNPGWAPSTYSHAIATPRFPQDTRHTTAACAKCHNNAANYTQFCCLSSGCHNTCQGGD
jgi:hypothetical protein